MNWRSGTITLLFIIFFCASCESRSFNSILPSPESTTKSFMRSMNQGNPDRALDKICESFVMIKLPEGFLKEDKYTLISMDDEFATVNITGEIRIKTDYGSAKKKLDFDLKLYKNNGEWCILRDSMLNLLNSIGDLSY